jgi:excisionase family DNA binding protein
VNGDRSRHLDGGWFLIAPGDVQILAALVAAGMRAQGVLRSQLGPLADELDVAAYASRAQARAAIGRAPSDGAAAEPSSRQENTTTVEEAAEVLGVSERQVRRMLAGGRLAGSRFGVRSWAVDVDSLAASAQERGAA